MTETPNLPDVQGGREPALARRRRDFRDRTTDSWTDVLPDAIELAGNLVGTEFLPQGLNTPQKATAAILFARELGLPPMTGLGSIHVIHGRVGLSAEMMRALVLQAGHELRVVEQTESRCRIEGRRKGSEEWSRASYTMAEAQKSGDARKNGNYQSRPVEMLLARATSRLCRMIFPDVTHGLGAPEEVQDSEQITGEGAPDGPPRAGDAVSVQRGSVGKHEPAGESVGEPVEATPERKRAPRRDTRKKAPAPAPEPEPEVLDAEVVDEPPTVGEVMDETGVGQPEPEPTAVQEDASVVEAKPDADRPPLSQRFVASIQMHFQRLGVGDRDERLYWTGEVVGRKVESTKDLTRDEAIELTKTLEKIRDREALERFGQTLDGGA